MKCACSHCHGWHIPNSLASRQKDLLQPPLLDDPFPCCALLWLLLAACQSPTPLHPLPPQAELLQPAITHSLLCQHLHLPLLPPIMAASPTLLLSPPNDGVKRKHWEANATVGGGRVSPRLKGRCVSKQEGKRVTQRHEWGMGEKCMFVCVCVREKQCKCVPMFWFIPVLLHCDDLKISSKALSSILL